MRKLSLKFALAVVIVLTFAAPASGGGWAVVTLDELPALVIADQPFTAGFTVRAHGRTPVNVETPAVIFYPEDGDKQYRFEAKRQGATGHYVVEVKLPQAGKWRWHIMTWMEHAMPDLEVRSFASTSAQPVGLSNVIAQLPWIGGWFRQATERAEMSHQTALGQDLFLAKGCATCHTHAAVSRKAGFSANVGPNLTQRPLDPNYLRLWLKDPSAVKPGTEMPALDLKTTEIEALTAFLTQSPPARHLRRAGDAAVTTPRTVARPAPDAARC